MFYLYEGHQAILALFCVRNIYGLMNEPGSPGNIDRTSDNKENTLNSKNLKSDEE